VDRIPNFAPAAVDRRDEKRVMVAPAANRLTRDASRLSRGRVAQPSRHGLNRCLLPRREHVMITLQRLCNLGVVSAFVRF
jgi:hypothetical protein